MTALSDGAVERLRAAARGPDLASTRYRLAGVAGQGGMATVYEAEDMLLGRRVALKVLDLADEAGTLRARLEAEARVLAQLEHPGIVPVHDVGQAADGRPFYVMKLVRGERLDRHLPQVPSLAERLRLFVRICEAVAFAHSRGILHRDLKPQNVMVGPFGEVLVLDWGLAKALDGAPDTAAAAARTGGTADGTVMGTPGYMAPEQAAGAAAAADVRADVYSLGAVLAFLQRDCERDPAIAAIAGKATAGAREQRYDDVSTLVADVTRFVDGEPVTAYPEGLWRRARRVLRRHRAALLLLAAYLAARALVLFFFRR